MLPFAGICADQAPTKSDVLHELTRAGITRLPERTGQTVLSYPETAAQLELDLIVYRWIARSLGMPQDIRNRDAIISTLQKSLNDPTVDYAAALFPPDPHARASTEPANETPLSQNIASLKEMVQDAVESRESSPAKAAESFAAAARLCQTMYLDLAEAAISKELGDIHHFDMARYRQAEWFYDRASSTFLKYRCSASSATVYDAWGTLSMTLGKYSDSAERYTQAARQWVELVKEDPSQFRNRDKAGLAYIRAGKAKEASGDYAGALDLMRSHGLFQLRNWAHATKSFDLLVRNLIIIAEFVRERRGDVKDSISLLNEARDAAALQNDPLLSSRVYEELAKVYASQNPASAESARLKQQKSLWEAAKKGDPALASAARPGLTRGELARLLSVVERSAVAYGALRRNTKAAELWKAVANAYGAAGMTDEQISCLRSLASTYDEMRRSDESLAARSEAVVIARKSGTNLVAAEIIMTIVQTYRDRNETQTALEGLNELVDHVLTTRNSRQAAEALEARGSLMVEIKHSSEAIEDFRDAFDKFTTLVGDVWAAGRVAVELAEAQTAAGKGSDARATLARALSNIESSYAQENYRLNLYPEHTRVVIELHRSLVENHIHGKDAEGALSLLRRAALRYPWFSDLMRDLRSSRDVAVSEFARTNNLIREPSDPNGTPGQVTMLAEDDAEYVTTCWKLQQNCFAQYAALPVDPLLLYRSKGSVPADTAVVSYLSTDFCIYAFICTRERCFVWQLDGTGVEEAVAKLRRTLEYCEQSVSTGVPVPPMIDWRSPAFLEIKAPLAALYGRLIAPIDGILKEHSRLVFALPKEFGTLPVGALIAAESNGTPVFLIQQHQVSYLGKGMLRDLVAEKSREIYPALDSLAIFADPEDNLPGARKEATTVKNAYLNSRWYVGSERATETNLLSECGRAGIIHVAAHHRVSANSVGFEMILAPDATSDGIVGVQELLTIPADSLEMIVLSACDTVGSSDPVSTGPARAAELFSLARARSVLGALWKVSDEAASQVFGEFYRNLARGKSRAESLRLAQQSVIESKRFAHPFYWACFALYGNPR